MKSQKGVTLISLTIYISVVLIAIGILTVVSTNLQTSIKDVNNKGTEIAEINKFNMYFLKEVKKQENKIEEITTNSIKFATGNTYIYDDQKKEIYLQKEDSLIKIAGNIDKCQFVKEIENDKTIIKVTIKAKNTEERTNEYVLNNKEFNLNYEEEDNYVYNVNIQNEI